MATKALPIYHGPRCRCGAARPRLQRICIKCDARNRWRRRTAAARPRPAAVVVATPRRRSGRSRSRGADR